MFVNHAPTAVADIPIELPDIPPDALTMLVETLAAYAVRHLAIHEEAGPENLAAAGITAVRWCGMKLVRSCDQREALEPAQKPYNLLTEFFGKLASKIFALRHYGHRRQAGEEGVETSSPIFDLGKEDDNSVDQARHSG